MLLDICEQAEQDFDLALLAEAIKLITSNESDWPESMMINGQFIGSAILNEAPPYNQVMGRVIPRGPSNGLILKSGIKVAQWGQSTKADMTFSIAKNYLSLLVGVAYDQGVIGSIDDFVGKEVLDGGYHDDHNQSVTWRHFLEQTSEWHGEVFNRPDSIDWHRETYPKIDELVRSTKGSYRALKKPGTHFEYNDIRINRLALSLLRLFKRPLPHILKKYIMDPLGCSDTWRWYGYDNSWVDVSGIRMQSVPGGAHWGGGLCINSEDHAKVAQMVMCRGFSNGRQIISEQWIDQMLTPSRHNKYYGLLWWLNTDSKLFPDLPASNIFAIGGGANIISVDPKQELIVVIRWIKQDSITEVLRCIYKAIRPTVFVAS